MREWADRHRVLLAGIVLVVLFLTTHFADSLTQVGSLREGCERGNAIRLTAHADALSEERFSLEIARQTHDREQEEVWRERAQRKRKTAEGVIGSAARTGELIQPNQPIVDCEDEYPQPFPL